jgi:hypothetical protein
MQYHSEFSSDCSSLVYHIDVRTIIAGCTQLSKKPRRNLTAMSEPKLLHNAEQATIVPQMKTLTESSLPRGSF